jgi:hypothetical protein
MKATLVLVVLATVLSAHAVNRKVVYGDDNRMDVYESNNALFIELAKSTAAMIPTRAIANRNGDKVISGSSMLSQGYCANERFSTQITAARCSGFLVGPKLLVTAGHCIETATDCVTNKWVFDFKTENAGTVNITVPATSVYGCTRVISRSLQGGNGNDYALVELDREVTDPLRSPTAPLFAR